MLAYITIGHAQTVGVSDLSCLEHTEQSTSVTEIVALNNLPVSSWVQIKVPSPDTYPYLGQGRVFKWALKPTINHCSMVS